jgi:hypothetical protein
VKRKKDKHGYHTRWTQFVHCLTWSTPDGKTEEIPDDLIVLRNNIYTVVVEGCDVPPPMGPMSWLSIKRNDRSPIRDWRELQRVKNAIMGEECEAVELFPAESRLHDTANQMHLWCFAPGYRLPFGYANRFVADETGTDGARQRAFNPDDKPADCVRSADLTVLFGTDPTLGTKLVHRRMMLRKLEVNDEP